MGSFLAFGAEEGGAAGLEDTPDGAAATGAQAIFTLTIVDGEMLLEGPSGAVGLSVVAQGGAAGGEGFRQDLFHLVRQPLEQRPTGSVGHGPCTTAGGQPGL